MSEHERKELLSYLANKFKTFRSVKEEYSEYASEWASGLMSSDRASEILNTLIIPHRPVNFLSPDDIKIRNEHTYAGIIPTITIGNDTDFENFIVNAAYRGKRPPDISHMGASFLYGKGKMMLVLSKKYYSNTPPEQVRLSPEEWQKRSMIIRFEHETVHYYTKKFYGTASQNIHDELIADFFGMRKAFGFYDSDLFCYFMGIDGTHEGRLSLYTSGMNDSLKKEIAEIAVKCSRFLESIQNEIEDAPSGIDFLCGLGINGMLESHV